jgi:hypothetical protein
MQKRVFALILASLAVVAPATADDEPPLVIFNAKSFTDIGHIVHVEGTLSGDGIRYKNNRSALTCYQDRRECLAIHIDAQGTQVFSIGPPVVFTVRLWTADRIIADFNALCGGFDSWIVDRTRQTAELIDHPCLGDKTYHWTIEDPPFWTKGKVR